MYYKSAVSDGEAHVLMRHLDCWFGIKAEDLTFENVQQCCVFDFGSADGLSIIRNCSGMLDEQCKITFLKDMDKSTMIFPTINLSSLFPPQDLNFEYKL